MNIEFNKCNYEKPEWFKTGIIIKALATGYKLEVTNVKKRYDGTWCFTYNNLDDLSNAGYVGNPDFNKYEQYKE